MPLSIAKTKFLVVLLLILVISVVCASLIGTVSIPITALLSNDLTEGQKIILWQIRLPRVLLAAIVGSGLAVSGAALQGLFRNPLADPGLIGVSSGSAFAVAIVVTLVGPVASIFALYSVSFVAFLGGSLTCLLVFYIARLTGAHSVIYLLLIGIAINALTASGTNFITYFSSDQQLRALSIWRMGSFGGSGWSDVLITFVMTVPAILLLWHYAKQLNILLLGEKEAQQLGVRIEHIKFVIVFCTAVCVAIAVSVSGIIGFVGLVVPHIIRLLCTANHRYLVPASALLGAILLVLADLLARKIIAPAEMPVGILTSLVGGPFFLWILVKQYARRFVI